MMWHGMATRQALKGGLWGGIVRQSMPKMSVSPISETKGKDASDTSDLGPQLHTRFASVVSIADSLHHDDWESPTH